MDHKNEPLSVERGECASDAYMERGMRDQGMSR